MGLINQSHRVFNTDSNPSRLHTRGTHDGGTHRTIKRPQGVAQGSKGKPTGYQKVPNLSWTAPSCDTTWFGPPAVSGPNQIMWHPSPKLDQKKANWGEREPKGPTRVPKGRKRKHWPTGIGNATERDWTNHQTRLVTLPNAIGNVTKNAIGNVTKRDC